MRQRQPASASVSASEAMPLVMVRRPASRRHSDGDDDDDDDTSGRGDGRVADGLAGADAPATGTSTSTSTSTSRRSDCGTCRECSLWLGQAGSECCRDVAGSFVCDNQPPPPPPPYSEHQQQFAVVADKGPVRALSFLALPEPQRRLVNHMASISDSIETAGTSNFVVYMRLLPMLLTISASYDYVRYSVMAWAASHMAYVTRSAEDQMAARHYRILSMQGLQEAIPVFNERNADGVLAASLLLSWQAASAFEWSTLHKGTISIITAMEPWRRTSLLSGFIEDSAQYNLSPGAATQLTAATSRSYDEEQVALRYIYDSLQGVERYAAGRPGELELIRKLMVLVKTVERHLPVCDISLRFFLLEPLRSMLFWYPAKFCREADSDPVVMVVLAHLYAISLTVQPVFAGQAAAQFRGLSVGPIEDIYAKLVERHRKSSRTIRTMETFVPLSLMHFPMQSVSLFRSRMGLDQRFLCVDQSLTAIRYGLAPLAEARWTEYSEDADAN